MTDCIPTINAARHKIDLTPEGKIKIKEEVVRRLPYESLMRICIDEGFPEPSIILRWAKEDPEFGKDFEQARELYGEAHADRLLEVNESLRDGSMLPAAAAVISANLKWLAEKNNQKRFGTRQYIEHGGNVTAEQVVKIEMVHVKPKQIDATAVDVTDIDGE